jgi:hypothetical protein
MAFKVNSVKIIIFLILLLIPLPSFGQDIELTMSNEDTILIIVSGDTVHVFAYGKKRRASIDFEGFEKTEAQIVNSYLSSQDKEIKQELEKDSWDYFREGEPIKGFEQSLKEAEESEKNGDYAYAFWSYLECFNQDKALEMLEKYKETIGINKPYKIQTLATMYRDLGMKEEYIETVKLLKDFNNETQN